MKKIFLFGSIGMLILTGFFNVLAFSKTEPKVKEIVNDSAKIEQIRELEEKGDFDAAIKKARVYLKSRPNNIETLIRLTECYSFKGNLSLAEMHAKKAVRLTDSKDVWALRVMASVYRSKSDASKSNQTKKKFIDLAKTEIEKALVISPDDAWVNAEAAQIYFRLNDKINATKAIGLAPNAQPEDVYFLGIKKQIDSME